MKKVDLKIQDLEERIAPAVLNPLAAAAAAGADTNVAAPAAPGLPVEINGNASQAPVID